MLERAYDMTKRSEAVEGTKRRIGEAALALFRERDYDTVTLNEIARAAGVSHQTVLNHCGSKAGVLPLAGALFTEQVGELQADAVAGDVASVVCAVCTRYEALGDPNIRWAALDSRIPEVAERLAEGRAYHQAWLRRCSATACLTTPRSGGASCSGSTPRSTSSRGSSSAATSI